MILGVGVGGEGEKDFEAVGVDPRERGARTNEAMRALRALFAAQPASFSGRFFSFAGRRDRPRARRSRAGRRSGSAAAREAAIRRAATLGDGWIPIWVSPERFREAIAQLPDHVVPAVTLPGARRRQAALCTSTCASGTPAISPSTSSTATASPARPRSAWRGCASTWTPVPGTSSSISGSPRTRSGWRRWPVQPLADVRILAIEQFGAGPVGHAPARRPRRRGDQDRGPGLRRRRRPLRAAVRRRARTRSSSRRSTATSGASRSTCATRRRAPSSRTSCAASDVVYSNLRGDQPAKLRLTYDDLKDVNPRIVCCSLSGFGMTGPRAAEGGYDYMMQGLAGWMSLTGDPDGPPTKSGLSLVDLSGGYASAIAVLAGLWRARRDGVGCDCDVSLFDTALHELMYVGTWAASRGYVAAAAAQLGASVDRPVPELRDRGRLDRRRLPEGEVLDAALRRDPATGPRRGVPDLRRPRPAPRRALADPRRGLPRPHERGVAGGAGRGGRPVLAGERRAPQRSRRRGSSSTSIRGSGTVRQVASPLRLSGPEPPARPAPARGEHTEQVLVEVCGYEPERIRALAESGVFGVESKGDRDAEASAAT